jgi:hypothetical protein
MQKKIKERLLQTNELTAFLIRIDEKRVSAVQKKIGVGCVLSN